MIELLLDAENALALGLLDQADRIYRTVLEADPRNGIAAVGLSRVALERGDDAGADALARAALEIDPENATARRMIDRLEEVARHHDAAAGAVRARGATAAGPPATDAAGPPAADAAGPPATDAAASRAARAASQAMIRAFEATEGGADPGSEPSRVPLDPDEAQLELAEASSAVAASEPGRSDAGPNRSRPRPGESAAEPMHESSPHRRVPEPEPAPTAEGPVPEPSTHPTGARQAAPARPGLLRRILGRS